MSIGRTSSSLFLAFSRIGAVLAEELRRPIAVVAILQAVSELGA
jgi:hypothetical protein